MYAALSCLAMGLMVWSLRSEEGFASMASWSEARQYGNDPYGKYPPCYDMSLATRAIFDILEKADGAHADHVDLLDAYSTVLCQKRFIDRACQGMMVRRINDLPPAPQGAERAVLRVHPGARGVSLEFLSRITGVLDAALAKTLKDPRLDAADRARIRDMHAAFTKEHYPAFVEC
jgi:hypothetical protein